MLPAIERAGLLVTDIEILRLHYAETLKAWRERFLAHREEVERIYDQRFVRMWEFYLAASEMSFREQNMMVMQIQLTKRQGVVPMTRDYIAREERRLRGCRRQASPAAAARRRIISTVRPENKTALTHRSIQLVNCGTTARLARFLRQTACYATIPG